MKIYKISQAATPSAPVGPTSGPTAGTQGPVIEEVMGAITTLNTAVANINQSLKIIEQNNIANLFQRDNLIKEIQSGQIAALDVNSIDQSLTAMANIARTIPVINKALRVLQDNDAVARQLNVDIRNIQNVLTTSIQKGDYSQFTAVLTNFQSMLPAMSGTIT